MLDEGVMKITGRSRLKKVWNETGRGGEGVRPKGIEESGSEGVVKISPTARFKKAWNEVDEGEGPRPKGRPFLH